MFLTVPSEPKALDEDLQILTVILCFHLGARNKYPPRPPLGFEGHDKVCEVCRVEKKKQNVASCQSQTKGAIWPGKKKRRDVFEVTAPGPAERIGTKHNNGGRLWLPRGQALNLFAALRNF